MDENLSSKESILNKIRKALENPVPLPFPGIDENSPVYPAPQDDLSVIFGEEFAKIGGKFAFAENMQVLSLHVYHLLQQNKWEKVYFKDEIVQTLLEKIKPYPYLESCDVAITTCECLVARTGSILLSSAATTGRTGSVYAPVHICLAKTSEVVYDIADAFQFLIEKYRNNIPSSLSFATGPSRTADIEKTLVTGVHGPKEAFVFLVEG